VKLVDVESGRKKKLDAKIPGSFAGLQFTPCGCYLIASVIDSRELFIFDIQASAPTTAPLCVVPLLGTPVNIHSRSTSSYIEVLCWFQSITTNYNYLSCAAWTMVVCYQIYIVIEKNHIIQDLT
jgi:hypothetical protein